MSRLPNWGKLSYYHRHFLPLLLLLFVERISVKKLMIALGIGAGLTAFNFLFGQSLNAGKYVTSTMLFVYIVVIIGMV